MRFIIFNGEKSVDINDNIIRMYESVIRPIDTNLVETILKMYGETRNTTKTREELSLIVNESLAEDIDFFYYRLTPEGKAKEAEAIAKAKENMRREKTEN